MPRPRNGTPPNALVSTALAKTVSSLSRDPKDTALIQLARRYADAIDEASEEQAAAVLDRIGPKLLAALVELGATPAARKSTKGGTPDAAQSVRSSMDELRARRVARIDGA